METSGKSKQSKKGRNKRLTNNRGRGDVFIKKPPVCLVRNKSADLNCEMEQTVKSEKSVEPEPVSEKPQVTLTTEESQLDVNSEEQQVARKQYLDSQLAPPPPVNPWTARAAMLQKNCRKTNEADVPLLSSQIPQPAITSQSSQVAARPKKTVVPKKVHKQPQPPKENPWLKSTKTKETINSLEIDEIDFPPLTAEKCVVAPEKKQAAKALNIRKITGSEHRRPHTGHYRVCTPRRTGSQLAVIPEEPELDVIVEDISIHVPQPSNTPQQAPISEATNPAEAFFQQTGVKMIAVPEIDFMEDKSEEIIKLESEQAALLKEVEQLREMLQTQRAVQAQEESKHQTRVEYLQLEISNTETSEKEFLCTVTKLEEAVEKEKSHQSEIETSMSHLRAENSRLVAALTQAEEDTKKETIQWEEEKSNLLSNIKEEQQILQDEMNRTTLMDSAANQSEESSRLVAALVKAEEEFKQETLQWEEEKSNLLQTISAQQQALENNTSNQLSDTLNQSEEDQEDLPKQWEEEEEKCSLLTSVTEQQEVHKDDPTKNLLNESTVNQNEDNSKLVAALVQAEEGLKQEALQWEEQKANLLKSITEQQQAVEQGTSKAENQDRHNGLEEQVAAILNRPRKPSLWKRFKRLFKRTVQPPVPPPSSQPS
ncbi:paramyosin [Larimichthys crocea]|uniref:paramyosin n=1 Tax=Larimichthys crocea TaxID=215358 RepID=UPI000F5F560A|nr:paramyosin [Larimichthys crocea]